MTSAPSACSAVKRWVDRAAHCRPESGDVLTAESAEDAEMEVNAVTEQIVGTILQLTSSPKIGPREVRESFPAEGRERTLSDVKETT